jgi:hypothetical protein
MIERFFIPQTTGNSLKGDSLFGFNVSRAFQLRKQPWRPGLAQYFTRMSGLLARKFVRCQPGPVAAIVPGKDQGAFGAGEPEEFQIVVEALLARRAEPAQAVIEPHLLSLM